MARITGAALKFPARAAVVAYLLLIAMGSGALLLPVSHGNPERPLSVIEAVFTATSAVCVTGLIVRSTPHDLSLVGQAVVLVLIQLGGIGILTVTNFVTLQLGGRGGLRQHLMLKETVGSRATDDLRWLLRSVAATVLVVEGAGFLLLAGRNLVDMPAGPALWHALFHTVSAFCNAGFALHDDSLIRYQTDPLVNLTICTLVIVGGIGFPVIIDFRRSFPWRIPGRPRGAIRAARWSAGELWSSLSLHSRLVVVGTMGLLVVGTLAFLVLEHDNTLKQMPVAQRLLVSFFQSTTARTAGFNTVDFAELTNATLFAVILLMIIGGGPCSTAGGFKVSTMMVLGVLSWSKFLGSPRAAFARRRISEDTIDRSVAVVLVFVLVGVLGLMALLVLEQRHMPHSQTTGVFIEAFFEIVSALGTVGLSTGITSKLNVGAQVLLIVLMFVGRLGPISIFVALSRTERAAAINFPKEDVLIG